MSRCLARNTIPLPILDFRLEREITYDSRSWWCWTYCSLLSSDLQYCKLKGMKVGRYNKQVKLFLGFTILL